jgi:hypothetical protein
MPDGKQMSCQVYGLAYFDLASGSNAPISWLQNANGKIVAVNQVEFSDIFTNINASVSYTYTLAGLSQDILISGAPAPPHVYGLNDSSTVLQIYTEWFNSPLPAMTAVTNGNVVDDQILDFGSMQMGVGQAFFMEGPGPEVGAGVVSKQWVTTSDSKTLLIEAIGYAAISNQFSQMPQASNIKPGRGSIGRMAFLDAKPPASRQPSKEKTPMKVAKAEIKGPRLKIDYDLLSSTNVLDLQGDTTYLVAGLVSVNSLVIEGGTVVKYTNNGYPEIVLGSNNIVCATESFSPGIFTSMNDNSVGSTISGSTGVPTQAPSIYLAFDSVINSSLVLSNLRFSYAWQALYGYLFSTSGYGISISDCQFFNCSNALYVSVSCPYSGGAPVNIYNSLFAQCTDAVVGIGNSSDYLNLSLVNVTADQVGTFLQGGVTNAGFATNSIFTATGVAGITSSAYCDVYNTNTGLFQPTGAASYYLVANSTNQGTGTANGLSAALLADLAGRTTYPPTVLSGWLTYSTNLSVQVPRNTGTPDRGYHYFPIDYALNVTVSNNVTVTVYPGVALALYGSASGSHGINLYSNAVLNCQGTATSPNYLVAYNTVQEQSNTNWSTAGLANPGVFPSLTTPSQTDSISSATFGFTEWSVMAGNEQIYSQFDSCPVFLENCQFYSGAITGQSAETPAFRVTNCLFWRVAANVSDSSGTATQTFCNNLFWRGSLTVRHANGGTYTFRDNLFDQTIITNKTGTIDICPSNAYISGFSNLASTYAAVPLTASPGYVAGPLGQYYYPSGQTNLIYNGSQYASNAALYHYTVTTNATSIDGTNVVSIGFHYVGVGTNTLPLDGNNDGLPDYLEDPNGTGAPGRWTSTSNAPFFGTYGIQPQNQSPARGSSATFSVTAFGAPTLTNQWLFNGDLILSANSTNYTISTAQFTNQGAYQVIIWNAYGSVTSTVAVLSIPVNVSNDVLLIYNTASPASTAVFNYYLANRPGVAAANTLGVDCSTNGIGNETYYITSYDSEFVTPVANWLANTNKRPQYVVLFQDLPTTVQYTTNTNVTYPWFSVQYDLNCGSNTLANLVDYSTNWHPYVTSINVDEMGSSNNCINYINKLTSMAGAATSLFISASATGYPNINWYFDNVDDSPPGVADGSDCVAGVKTVNPTASIFTTSGATNFTTRATNVAGYYTCSYDCVLTNCATNAINGVITFSGNSGWYVMSTTDSYNGLLTNGYNNDQWRYITWFCSNSFGSPNNYANTPVGAVVHVQEPFGSTIESRSVYFGDWAAGSSFGVTAWNSLLFYDSFPYRCAAIGDPFVSK